MTATGRGVGTELEVAELEVRYAAVVAVRRISFVVRCGTILAVTGPSGAGKSSLLWALAGAVAPHTGTVLVGGAAVHSRVHAAQLGVGLVPQGNGLVTTLTARENVVVPLLAGGVDVTDAHRRTTDALATVGLEDSKDHLIEELSGGQQQRVAIARALAAQCSVLLADEPTTDLDEGNRRRVVAALREQADAGAVVLVATNDPETAAEMDSEIILDEGAHRWR